MILFSRRLNGLVGVEGPVIMYSWYWISGHFLKLITPAFGKMTAEAQTNEGEYRGHHFDILTHAEEIGFYNGGSWENTRVENSFQKLIKHSKKIIYHRFFNGIYDSILVKYGAFVFGYVIVGLPVFGPNSEEYLARIGGDTSTIVKDYVRNTGMLINLAKAIGRIVISYKEIQSLAGYTALVTKFDTVLEDMRQGKFERQILNEELVANQGQVNSGQDFIKFDAVPILAPNGE